MSPRTGRFPTCDLTLDEKTKVGPLKMLLVNVVSSPLNCMPSVILRQGDKALTLTLRLLEETQDIMQEDIHSGLQKQHDQHALNGGLKARLTLYGKIREYRDDAVTLSNKTVASSQYSHSLVMWNTEGKSIHCQLRPSKNVHSDELSIVTVDHDGGAEHQGSVTSGSSTSSLVSFVYEEATTSDPDWALSYETYSTSDAVELQEFFNSNTEHDPGFSLKFSMSMGEGSTHDQPEDSDTSSLSQSDRWDSTDS